MELILVNKKELQEMLGEIRPSNKQPESIKEEVKYLSPVEAREYMKSKGIHISKSTLYKLTSNKKIPFTHFGKKKILFRAEELDAWVESRLIRSSDANPVTIAVAKEARKKKL